MRTLALIAYPLGMAIGQIMFKMAALQFGKSEHTQLLDLVLALLTNTWLISALILYALLTLVWVWILAEMPLSLAYPFAAFSFILTPVLAHFIFDEAIRWNHAAGLVLLIVGILVIVK